MPTRSQTEIAARAHEVIARRDSLLGTEASDLIGYLDFEHAEPFLAAEATPGEWGEVPECTAEAIKAVIVDYLPFAFDKAHGERGLSSMRSVEHFQAWLWLLADHDLLAAFHAAPYEPYGLPKLRVIRAALAPEMSEEEYA